MFSIVIVTVACDLVAEARQHVREHVQGVPVLVRDEHPEVADGVGSGGKSHGYSALDSSAARPSDPPGLHSRPGFGARSAFFITW